MQREGKVRWIGVSNFSIAQLERLRQITPVTSLQPPYSLLFRGIEADALPYTRHHRIGVLAYSPMKHGLLSGAMTRERIAAFPADDHRRGRPEFQEPALTRILEVVEKLRKVGVRHGLTPSEVAIAWVLGNPAITGAIVGLRNPQQLEGVIRAADFRLSDQEAAEIESRLG